MNPEDATPGPQANPVVRWFLVGLPAGLFVLGMFSFVIYFQRQHAREAALAAPSKYAAILRRDVNLDDYRRYMRVFGQEIGPRTPGKPDNLEAAQSFIESTLGFGNMGYQVARQESESGGRKLVHFEVETQGQSASLEPVFVTARYDGAGIEDISALLMLANAFTGTRHPRIIRFVAWCGSGGEGENFDLKRYRESLSPDAVPDKQAQVIEIKGPRADNADALGELQAAARAITAAAAK